MRVLLLLMTVSLAAGAACGSEGPGPAAAPTSTSTSTSTSMPGADHGDRFATTTVSVAPRERGLLAAVRATGDGGVEMVTFEFEGALPGYRVGYVQRPLVEDGSGDEVAIEGDAILGVHFEPASGADLSGEEVRIVYKGPERITVTATTLTEVVRVSDFEANLDWAIGLRGKVPFRVRTLREPSRVVVEVQPATGS